MDSLLQDLRSALRVLRRSPFFSAIVATVLALGIGANTAIFSLVHAVLLRPLPYRAPDRLVVVSEVMKETGTIGGVTIPNFVDWRAQNTVFSSMAARQRTTFNLTGRGEPERLSGVRTTHEYFATLGMAPVAGRLFEASDDRPGAPAVALLSHGLWTRVFAGDRGVVGQTIHLDGHPHTVVGVLPAGAELPGLAEDLWVPAAFAPREMEMTGAHTLRVIARLGDGVSLAQAREAIKAIGRQLETVRPGSNKAWAPDVAPLHAQIVRNSRASLLTLLGAVGLVALIACANVANLLLARMGQREREMAVRAAIGASRARMLRQLLCESVILGLVGGSGGLLLGAWGSQALAALVPGGVPLSSPVGVDVWVVGFTVLLSLATGVLFGLAPAVHASKVALGASLKEGARTAGGGRAAERMRGALMVSEVALAMVLLVGAGLLMRSFVRLQDVDLGFDTRNLLALQLSLPASRYSEPRQTVAFYNEVLDRVAALPGVTAVAATSDLPVASPGWTISVLAEGLAPSDPTQAPMALMRVVSPDYLRALGVGLLRGRPFDARDREGAPRVAIVNATMARQIWGDQDPIGRRFKIDDDDPRLLEVVGVANDIRHLGLDRDAAAEFFTPYLQATPDHWEFSNRSMTVAVRSAGDPRPLVSLVRAAIASVDKDLPLYNVRTMDEVLERSLAGRRASLQLLALFAGAALVLASVGLYGVVSYSVSQRTREFGVRMAMGAGQADVLRLVLGRAARVALLGLAAGFAATLALKQLMKSFVFGITATDPVTFAAVGALLLAVALFAAFVPARRAARLSPVEALRYE